MVFNATFNNISVISCRSVLLVGKPEYPEKTTELPHLAMSGIQSDNVSGNMHGLHRQL